MELSPCPLVRLQALALRGRSQCEQEQGILGNTAAHTTIDPQQCHVHPMSPQTLPPPRSWIPGGVSASILEWLPHMAHWVTEAPLSMSSHLNTSSQPEGKDASIERHTCHTGTHSKLSCSLANLATTTSLLWGKILPEATSCDLRAKSVLAPGTATVQHLHRSPSAHGLQRLLGAMGQRPARWAQGYQRRHLHPPWGCCPLHRRTAS